MTVNEIIYLDYAAATPLDKRVFAVMEPYFTEKFFNPSSPYEQARQVRREVNEARSQIARIIGAKPDEIVFTAGATESVNLAFSSIVNSAKNHVVVSAIEHQAVLEVARQGDYTEVGVDERGNVTPDAVVGAIKDNTVLVSIALGNNEIGTLQPLHQIASRLQEIRQQRLSQGNKTPLYFHSDASQGAGLVDIHTSRLGVDLLTLNAGKIYGPKQTGMLWARAGIKLQPLVHGGGQERGLRSGTENVPSIIGFAKALELAEKGRRAESSRLLVLKEILKRELAAAFGDAVIFSGNPKRQLPHILHASWAGLDAERAIFRLEAQGVLVATGAACAANKDTCSHVLKAIGLPKPHIDGSLRFSLGRGNDEEQITRAAKMIIEVVKKEQTR